MQNRKQIIIGGLGFIGSNIAKRLAGNSEVLCVDDLSNAIPNSFLRELEREPKIEILQGDVNDVEIQKAMERWSLGANPDLWHMAANSDIRKSVNSPILDFDKSFSTTISAIQIADRLDSQNLIFASTSAVYGVPSNPLLMVDEESQISPISYYGAAKFSSEIFLNTFRKMKDFNLFIFRFANIVGAPATHGLIFDIMKHIKAGLNPIPVLGDGNQTKSYLLVEDLVDDMITLVSNNCNGTYNLSPGDFGISVRQIVECIISHVAPDKRMQFEKTKFGWPGDIPIITLSAKKSQDLLKSQHRTSFESIHLAIHAIATQLELDVTCANL